MPNFSWGTRNPPQSVREGGGLAEPCLSALGRVQAAQRRQICAEARRSAGRAAFALAQSQP